MGYFFVITGKFQKHFKAISFKSNRKRLPFLQARLKKIFCSHAATPLMDI